MSTCRGMKNVVPDRFWERVYDTFVNTDRIVVHDIPGGRNDSLAFTTSSSEVEEEEDDDDDDRRHGTNHQSETIARDLVWLYTIMKNIIPEEAIRAPDIIHHDGTHLIRERSCLFLYCPPTPMTGDEGLKQLHVSCPDLSGMDLLNAYEHEKMHRVLIPSTFCSFEHNASEFAFAYCPHPTASYWEYCEPSNDEARAVFVRRVSKFHCVALNGLFSGRY